MYRSIHEIELMKFIKEEEGGEKMAYDPTAQMPIPNNWETDEIVHCGGHEWWNKTTDVKFVLVNEDEFFAKYAKDPRLG